MPPNLRKLRPFILTFIKSLINYRTTEPKWRNRQTRYVQGVVSITLVWVRLPPSASRKQLEHPGSSCFYFRKEYGCCLDERENSQAQTAVSKTAITSDHLHKIKCHHWAHCGRCYGSRQPFHAGYRVNVQSFSV